MRAECDAAVLRDDGGNLSGELQDRGAGVAAFQKRNHLAAEIADFAVGQDGLKAITDGGEILTIVNGEEDHHAAIFSLVANAPFFSQLNCVVRDGVAFRGVDGDDVKLCVGLIVKFGGELGELVARIGREGIREIVDRALRLKVRDFFGTRGDCYGVEQQKTEE